MTDLNDKYRERWQDRRKKAYNWKKLIIMSLLLVVLIIAINKMNQIQPPTPNSEVVQTDTLSTNSDSLNVPPTMPSDQENK